MKFSTKTRYGSRALLELALHEGAELMTVKEIAGRQDISARYLENIMVTLVSGGIVRSTRGKQGGFHLTRPPGEIHMAEIVRLLEGTLAPVDCVDGSEVCDRAESCVTHEVWKKVSDSMNEVLVSVTLQDMVDSYWKKMKKAPMYHI